MGPLQVLLLQVRVDQGAMAIKGYSASDCFMSYLGYSLVGGGLTLQQRCSQCMLQPQPTGLCPV